MSSDFVTITVANRAFKLNKAFFAADLSLSHLDIGTAKASFTNSDGFADVHKFLSALVAIPAAQRFVQTKALIDGLCPANFEAIVDLLLTIKFEFPNKLKPKDAANNHTELVWPEYLLEKLPICLDAKLLAAHCKAYTWYVAASRRVVTIAHMSSTGLSKDFLRFVNRLTKEDPALAFALSPTTLHDNTLVAPKTARYFTCSPFGVDSADSESGTEQFTSQGIETSYKPVFLNEKSSHVKLGSSNRASLDRKKRQALAEARLVYELKGIKDEHGSFPWFHPSRPDTGVILAGGLPCAVTLDEAKWQLISKTTDIDLFIYGDSEDDRKDMTRIVLEHLESLGGKINHFVSVFKVDNLGREIQVVCPYARSPLGVLINFDSTFIQIGYQNGNFIATPGHCFFTPRSETLITRYNVRFHRMLKAIERGFMPVSDARGHLMYPTKTVFSSRWPFALSGSEQLDAEWVDRQARLAYAVSKKVKGVDDETLKKMLIEDKELFDVVLAECDERAQKSRKNESVTMTVYDAEKVLTEVKREDMVVTSLCLKTAKPHIEWIPTTTAEAMETFHPQGATLSNGFDIYTAGVNSTLPIPEDGDTEGIYIGHVLLRNVKVVPSAVNAKGEKQPCNLAAPKDKPLMVEHQPFADTDSKYPQRYADKEPVREIEGIFLFGDIKDPKMLEKDFKTHLERREANAKKLKAFTEKKQQARYERHQKESAKRRELEDQRRAAKGLPSLAEQAELDRKALEARRKLQQAKREAAIATKNAKEASKKPVKTGPVVANPLLQAVKQKSETKGKEELDDVQAVGPNAKISSVPGPLLCATVAPASTSSVVQKILTVAPEIVKVAQPVNPAPPATKTIPIKKEIKKSAAQLLKEAKKAKDIEDAEKKKDAKQKKDFSLRSTIDFGDLHRFMAEPAKLVTIGVHELPMLYKAFAKGGKEYTTTDKKQVIKRSDGMVKVRAPVSFSECMVFDVDDLFVATKSVDSHPERRYNAVVHLANLERWIIKAHEHKDVITSSSSRDLIMAALQEELAKEDNKYTSAPVAEFMRAIKHVANTKAFEEKANQVACYKPHAHPGLPGEMPTLFISRLYVSRV